MKKLALVAGARPNFMKIAPIMRALEGSREYFDWRLIHTGQHYDEDMSDVFFSDLGIPQPDFHLGVGGGSHAQQTARIMISVEPIFESYNPDVVLVVGDVDSTVACGLTAKKLKQKLAHVEAGLRSGDMEMPEEINRIVTDSISDYLFVTEQSGVENLRREGKLDSTIHLVGHVMVDNLFYQREKLVDAGTTCKLAGELGLSGEDYAVLTLHRPSNVDVKGVLEGLMQAVEAVSERLPVVFPIHPRTRQRIEQFGIDLPPRVHFLPPLGYQQFLGLWSGAKLVLTDSGGLQEETTALKVPCITLRENTERPVTVELGSNQVVGTDPQCILSAVDRVLAGISGGGDVPFWDGRAAERILEVLKVA